MNVQRISHLPSFFDLSSRCLADELVRLSGHHESVNLAVCGGRSVAEIFKRLLRFPEVPFEKVHIFMADERVVPVDHPDWNGALVEQVLMAPLLASGRILPGNWHPFKGDAAEPDFGAARYSHDLAACGGKIHLLLLSAGEDGHIASLFPGKNHGPDSVGYIPVSQSPKPPAMRVSLTAKAIRSAESAVLLVTGEAKRQALAALLSGTEAAQCPATHATFAGRHLILTDLD